MVLVPGVVICERLFRDKGPSTKCSRSGKLLRGCELDCELVSLFCPGANVELETRSQPGCRLLQANFMSSSVRGAMVPAYSRAVMATIGISLGDNLTRWPISFYFGGVNAAVAHHQGDALDRLWLIVGLGESLDSVGLDVLGNGRIVLSDCVLVLLSIENARFGTLFESGIPNSSDARNPLVSDGSGIGGRLGQIQTWWIGTSCSRVQDVGAQGTYIPETTYFNVSPPLPRVSHPYARRKNPITLFILLIINASR
jgi:hypothetical protein